MVATGSHSQAGDPTLTTDGSIGQDDTMYVEFSI